MVMKTISSRLPILASAYKKPVEAGLVMLRNKNEVHKRNCRRNSTKGATNPHSTKGLEGLKKKLDVSLLLKSSPGGGVGPALCK